DFQTKLKAINSFLDDGDKVKVSLRFKGREMAHQELGAKMMERIRAEVEEKAKVEQMPRMENRQMLMVIAPR
ncbi:translation initiation factor IF-3, partial [Gluconobacter japonicus]